MFKRLTCSFICAPAFSPQYLRKQFFPRQKLLEYAGLLNPLDAPHHLRTNEHWFYREGVTLPLRPAEGKGSWVDVGLYETKIQIDKRLQQGLRVTVRRTDITEQEYLQAKEASGEFDSPSEEISKMKHRFQTKCNRAIKRSEFPVKLSVRAHRVSNPVCSIACD